MLIVDLLDLAILMCVIVGLGAPALFGMAGALRLLRRLVPFQWTGTVHGEDVPQRIPPDPCLELDAPMRSQVEEIRLLLDENLRRIGATANGIPLAVEMQQLRDNHLPALLDAYARIPPAHRKDVVPGTGLDATRRLAQGLDGMLERTRAVEGEISRGSLEAFADSARFVDARYGRRHDEI